MGLIQDMAKKGGRMGAKLPVPTTAGDDQVIAAKTGEYVLPPEVVAAIGLDKLNALVASITGQQPGGEPAEMPEGAMHEMMEGEMEGHAKGGKVKGYALGGQIGKWDGVNVDPFEKQSLNKYSFGADGSALDDSVSRQIDRSAKGLMQSDEVFDAARPELEDRMRRQPNGLISQLMGYANGGIIDDLYGETQAKRANLRNYNPQSSIPPNATTNASPRAPELRSYTPEPGRLQPGATTPRITGLAAAAPAGTPSATVRALDARVPGDAAAVEAQRAKAAAQAGKLTGEAQRAAATAAQPPKPGLVSRAVQTFTPSRATVGGALAGAGIAGAGQAISDIGSGYRDEFNRSVSAESPLGTTVADTVRTLATVGDAATFGLAGRVGRGIASATGGGSFGEGFASPSDRERFADSQRPTLSDLIAPNGSQPAPQMTDKERADEIARRRAALEGPQAAPAAAPTATPTQAIAAAPAPATRKAGPISGLAARAQPAAPAAAPANAAPMDGAVEIIRGQNRSWAVPELGYQEVPDEVYRSGRIGEYMQAQSNNMMDRADPVAAELRTRLAEIAAQGDNSIRVSNATDRDGKGRGLRNQLAEIELQQRQQIAELEKQALAGNQEAVQRIQQLRSRGDNDGRAKLVTDLVKAYSGSAMQPVGADGKPMSLEQYVNQGLELATGTVKSSSTPAGMKQVGTSGGKPVYQDAQGNRFIGD